MPYLTSQLITKAYYKSQIVGRGYEVPTPEQVSLGLESLNDLLADKFVDSNVVPYMNNVNFDADTGNPLLGITVTISPNSDVTYFIPNLISVETFVFYINGVRYATLQQNRKAYYGSSRYLPVQSLPFMWHTERKLGGTNLSVYFMPDKNYPMEVWGQFGLANVTLFQDLSLTLDQFYINFLTYQLAVRLCDEFTFSVPPDIQKQADNYYNLIKNATSSRDTSIHKITQFRGRNASNWAQIVLGHGLWP